MKTDRLNNINISSTNNAIAVEVYLSLLCQAIYSVSTNKEKDVESLKSA